MGSGAQGRRAWRRGFLLPVGLLTLAPETLAARLRLTVITDEDLARERGLDSVIGSALNAGASAIQVRSKGTGPRGLLALARRLAPRVRAAGALLIVNDRLDVALAVEADGVHLGPDDLPVSAACQASPDRFLVGYSTDEPDDAQRAEAEGASYIGCGAVYATLNKADPGDTIGLDGLRRVVDAVDVPVVGIGGITVERAVPVAATGAAGCAVVGAVMGASDPEEAARSLLEPFQPR